MVRDLHSQNLDRRLFIFISPVAANSSYSTVNAVAADAEVNLALPFIPSPWTTMLGTAPPAASAAAVRMTSTSFCPAAIAAAGAVTPLGRFWNVSVIGP